MTAGGERATCYWAPGAAAADQLGGDSDYVEALREHQDTAVRAQLRGAEGKVGAQLSGGLDSSAVAATAARLMAPAGGQVVAFTSVPRDGFGTPWKGLVDEGPLAAATAALYPNMEHVLVRPLPAGPRSKRSTVTISLSIARS